MFLIFLVNNNVFDFDLTVSHVTLRQWVATNYRLY